MKIEGEDALPKKEFYDPGKRVDIVSPARRHLIENFGNRDPEDMLRYYASRIGRINEMCHDIKDKLDKLMANPETTLYGDKPISKKLWMQYWELLEESGERFDEHGVLLPKYQYNPDLMQNIGEESNPVYGYKYMFGGLLDLLFKPGNDNIIYGKKGDGKSNFMLNLGIEAIKSGRYRLVTNLGVIKEYKHPDIIKVSWMSELLKIVCNNRIENIKLENEGKENECKYLLCIIDECENFIMSLRSLSKEVVEFNKFNQMTRKLDLSISMIFHRFEDVPKSFRDSPNLNSTILKGIDEEGNRMPNPQQTAIVDIKAIGMRFDIDRIPKNPVLDTRRMSGFSISHKKFPEKSVDLDQIFRIVQDTEPEDTPEAILEYLDTIRLENRSLEELLDMAREVEKDIRKDIYKCKKPEEYMTLAVRAFEEKHEIPDVKQIKNCDRALKKVVSEFWNLYHIEKRGADRKDVRDIDYRSCSFDELKVFLEWNTVPAVKGMVGVKYREFNRDEILDLEAVGVSKGKLVVLYGMGKIHKMRGYKK